MVGFGDGECEAGLAGQRGGHGSSRRCGGGGGGRTEERCRVAVAVDRAVTAAYDGDRCADRAEHGKVCLCW